MLKAIKVLYNNSRLRHGIKGRDLSLLYHFVGPATTRTGKFHAVTQQQFITQISSLKKHWRFTGEEEFFSAREDRFPRILLTFDDGYRQTLNMVSDFLSNENIPFVFFVNSSLLQGQYLWRDKLRVLIDNGFVQDFIDQYRLPFTTATFYEETKDPKGADSKKIAGQIGEFITSRHIALDGFEDLYCRTEDIQQHAGNEWMRIGNHSANHYCLSTISGGEQEKEIMDCQQYLVQQFGKHKVSSLFSVPFGGYSSFNKETIDILRKNNFKGVMATEGNTYFNRRASLTTEELNFPGYKRLLPKSNYRF